MTNNSNQPKHTQGEWKIEKRTKLFDAHISCGDKIIGFAAGSPQDEANIEHIVKCVNMHDNLIEALNGLKSMVETTRLNDEFKKSVSNENINMMSAALLRANKLLQKSAIKQAEGK